MASTPEPGCRDAALATGLLLGIGIALFVSGLALVNRESCTGVCEFAGLAMLYAGGPISALIGVLTDSVIVAWPLEVVLWVVLGYSAARWGAARGRSTWAFVTVLLIGAVGYGIALSQLVELA
ncbi:MAG: hypothetical protein OEM39_00915 [Acidimicrobiia bacterium]|nr:hypothetical protein [Acidimicrobiia bacterium]